MAATCSTSTTTEPSSWGDMLRSIEHDKKNLPWDPLSTQPVERVSIYNMRREERHFDPVGQKFNDPKREVMYQTTKAKRLQNISDQTVIDMKTKYNIIGHFGPARRHEHMLRPATEASGRDYRSYNLLNGLDKSDHKVTKFLYDDNDVISKIKNRKKVYHHVPVNTNREFNIVNNQYYSESNELRDERVREQFEKTKDEITRRYFKTHDFNPIINRYYDDNKNQLVERQEKVLQQVKGVNQMAKLPPSIAFSEGFSYNIVNNTLHDEERLKTTMTVHNRAINKAKKGPQILARLVHEGEAVAERDYDRRMRKPQFQRWKHEVDRSSHLISNKPLTSTERHMPLPKRPSTMWARITDKFDNNNSNNNNRNSMGSSSGFLAPQQGNNASELQLLAQTQPVKSKSAPHRDLSGLHEMCNTITDNNHNSNNNNNNNNNSNNNHSNTIGMIDSARYRPTTSATSQSQSQSKQQSKLNPKKDVDVPKLDLTKANMSEPGSARSISTASKATVTATHSVRTGGLSGYR